MFKGKVHAALDLLTNKGCGSVLCLDHQVDTSDVVKSVRESLRGKHPTSQPVTPDSIIQGVPSEIHPVVIDSIDARLICSILLRTTGAAGSSGLDAQLHGGDCALC